MTKTDELATTQESPLDRYQEDLRLARDSSWDEIWDIAQQAPEDVLDARQLGDGFKLLESANDKRHLVGVPFVIFDWKRVDSKRFPGRQFTSFVCKTRHQIAALGDEQNFRVNDGGIGQGSITNVLQGLRDNGFIGWVRCMKGLRISDDYDAMEDVLDEKTGQPLVDGSGQRIRRVVVDPATGQPIKGRSFYLDLSV